MHTTKKIKIKNIIVLILVGTCIFFAFILYLYLNRTEIVLYLYDRLGYNEHLLTFNNVDDTSKKEYLEINSNEDHEVLNSYIDSIFHSSLNIYSDEQKVLKLLHFSSSVIKHKMNRGNATEILKERFGICGAMNIIFISLCKKIEIPAKYIGNFNLNGQGSHAASEVYYDSTWHFFDPTYGLFYYSEPEYQNGRGKILSIDEILKSSDRNILYINDSLWQGKYNYKMEFREPQNIKNTTYFKQFAFKGDSTYFDTYNSYIDNGYPLALGLNDAVSFPIDVNLKDKDNVIIGKINDSNKELYKPLVKENIFKGFPSIGKGNPSIFHTFYISNIESNFFSVRYYTVNELNTPFLVKDLRTVKLIDMVVENSCITYQFFTNDDIAIFSVFSPEHNIKIDAIEIIQEGKNENL